MRLSFAKMHGLGNDFVVLSLINQPGPLKPSQVRKLADRRLGIGCDQVLVVEASTSPGADFNCRIYNADGSEAQQCGNGVRCLALFLRERKLTTKRDIRLATPAGTVALQVLDGGLISANLGAPILEPAHIPFRAEKRAIQYLLPIDGRDWPIAAVSMGNPHAVSIVPSIQTAPVADLGPRIQTHPDFPEQANVGFMEVVSPVKIRLRVFERGAGETPACGSGACAAVVAGRLQGLLDDTVRVHLPGGELHIAWAGEGEGVIMAGPAETVFEGVINL